jgi:hypothetical protein
VELEPAWIDRVQEISRVGIHNSAAQDSGILCNGISIVSRVLDWRSGGSTNDRAPAFRNHR